METLASFDAPAADAGVVNSRPVKIRELAVACPAVSVLFREGF
ncbi:hypothetical protein RISK_001905 [Rhodopirellula islandica]|uniref:Uncharacterized protein n=1 Tax=Rhodopirellula islandica TaxID=595434 RepID=A0A0J1EKH1_RHOIS|nr:hypothetical protein RISK_001905 [Rhodopirellula islandica]